ncbi:DUF3606 domain-containing protein [Pseudoxanthomonas indica]|uniref:DUF3606 domain-containing protein n=1 Tax=Pseudoxanthomonas indica TaxID=428993 RepID=A0A1T5JE72_9GAMM|nr:DUF3606 domain-containing protein [Pseudoxanthomonas indica]SKC49689.1 Protein of unknown function [Pseudoxanthomonas indica]
MSDDLTMRGEPDRSRIALGEEHEVRYWTKKFGVTEEDLRVAIDAVGKAAKNVELWLARRK